MVFFALTFFVLTLCIPPMQGWYYWVIPFAAYFYSKSDAHPRILYYGITAAYFLYFAVIPASDYFAVFALVSGSVAAINNAYTFGESIGLPVLFFVNLSFTILQSLLLLTIYFIYRKGVEQYISQKMHYQSFLIGVVGDSGSGKTTFAELMKNVFAPRNTTVIAGDDMHKWERGNEMWSKYTHLDPLANELHADIKNVYAIKHGETVVRRHYDHQTGKFGKPIKHEPRRLVIFEGLHAFFLDKVRNAFDLKVYIAPEEQLRLHWKILRDFKERGYTKQQVLDALEQRKDDSERYIAVQEKHSDIIISLRNNVSLGKDVGNEDVVLSPSLFITCANDIFIEPLLDELEEYISIDYVMLGEKQRVKFSGSISELIVKEIADTLLPELDEISQEDRIWKDGYQGVIQLFVTFYMFKMMALEQYGK
jgi:uridine kinase